MSEQENEGDQNPQPNENVQRPTNEIVQNSDPKKPDYIPKPGKKKKDD